MRDDKCSSKIVRAGVAGAALLSAYLLLIRLWHLRWGATDEELEMPLPGDELIEKADYQITRAATINAPASKVWPWLVQIGQGRGGFYSYSWLENLIGLHVRNADRILPECQELKIGDFIRAAPQDWLGGRYKEYAGWHAAALEPGRALVLRPQPKMENSTWAFVLNPIDEVSTRLAVRLRFQGKRSLLGTLFVFGVGEPAHFIMERKMLLGIKQRAEASVAEGEIES
jgi:hypothetical protein